jgi:3-oxoacyl-[acyl-carrier protein] reductase
LKQQNVHRMNIIVTGASRGIGHELVKLLSANVSNNVIAISRNAEKLKQLQTDCFTQNKTNNVRILPCDLANTKAIETLATELKKQVSTIDVLINNAGAIVNKPFETLTPADLSYVYQVNVFSVVQLIQAVLPMMNTVKKSHIVTISSMGGFQGSMKFAGLSAYSSSKAALACLTECLAEEFKEKNIAFNCLALGAAQTEMLNEAFPGYKAPLSSLEMASYIADFASNAHQFMNGRIIPVSLSTP